MKFYILRRTPRRDNKIPLETTDDYPGSVLVNCPACGAIGIMPASNTGRLPVEILVRDVGYLDDLEQASSTFLASRKMREAITSAGLTGIEFYDLVGYKLKRDTHKLQEVLRQARDVFQFQVLRFTGRSGSIGQKSGMILRKSCDKCGWREWTLPEHGYHVDESQWDGSDFFHVEEGPGFMSERAVQLLQAANLSNFGAILAEEFRLPAGYKQPALSTAATPPPDSPGERRGGSGGREGSRRD